LQRAQPRRRGPCVGGVQAPDGGPGRGQRETDCQVPPSRRGALPPTRRARSHTRTMPASAASPSTSIGTAWIRWVGIKRRFALTLPRLRGPPRAGSRTAADSHR
jgi:hypothetical protein